MITLENARNHLKLTTTLDEKNFSPFIPDAIEKYLRPFLGDSIIALLWSLFDGTIDEANKTRIESLMAKVEAPLARFTFLLAAPSLDINIGQGGFTTAGSTNMVPASEARVKRFTDSIEKLGWDGVETMLRFLFTNKSDYDEWTQSNEYKTYTRGFIRSAEKFNAYVDIDGSYLKFFKMNQSMLLIETLQIEPLLSTELYDALKDEDIAGTNTNANRVKARDLICKAVALLTATEQISETYRNAASHVYNMLRDHLNANPTDFPELFPDPTVFERAPYSGYENTAESPVFLFGGGV